MPQQTVHAATNNVPFQIYNVVLLKCFQKTTDFNENEAL